MKLHQIALTDFRCYDQFVLPLTSRRTWILGNTASGKSTVFDAVRFLLTGVCRGLDRAGRGLPVLVRQGATGFKVSAVLEHGGKTLKLSRTYHGAQSTFAVEEWKGSSQDQERTLWQLLGVNQVLLSVILDSDVFFDLTHGDAKALIMALLNVQVEVPLDKQKTEGGTETIGLDELERRYQVAFKERTDVNRDLKTITLVEPAPLTGASVEDTKKKLDELREQRDTLLAQKSEQKGAKDATHRRRKQLEQEAETLRVSAPGEDPSVLVDQVQQQIDTTQGEIERLTASIKLPDPKTPTHASLLADAHKLTTFKPTDGCVLDASISCPQKVRVFRDRGKVVEEQAEELADAGKALRAVHDEIGRLTRIKADQAFLWSKANDEAVVARQRRTRLAEIESELEGLAGEPVQEGLPVEDGAPTQLDADLETLRVRIEKGRVVLDDKIRLQGAHDQYATQKAKRDAIEARVKVLDDQVKLYGPNGVRVTALTAAKGQFEANVNAVLEPFGYTMQLSVDPWTLLVNGRQWVMLSTSEKLRVGIALQAAMTVTTGLSFLLVDQVDILLSRDRKTLLKVLLEAPIDQTLLARSFEPDEATPTKVQEGTQLVRLGATG